MSPPILLSVLLLVLGLAGCGQTGPTHFADTEGVYVDAGPITYQVQLSRELNPYDIEDRGYLAGLPTGTAQPAPNEEWFAIFLWGKNQTRHAQTTTGAFDLVDTQGNMYSPVAITPSANPYAWTSQTLLPASTEPMPGTTASFGPTQGAELLFKIKTSVYSNRPILLQIRSPSRQQVWGTVSIDL